MIIIQNGGKRWLAVVLAVFGLLGITVAATDPLFDLDAIAADPVEIEVLESDQVDGIVFETFEFTSRVVNGEPERIRGIFAYPEGGLELPAVFWSQGGMSAADRAFPGIFARKGYACMAITLPHSLRRSFQIAFDASNPEVANMTLLARDQLRGITVLSQRPQVDPDRIAVAGTSYGGVFATLIAGVDSRVKAGFSFFAGGHHALGTNLPQFQGMNTLADVEVWNRTFDGAFRLKDRAVPFMWGVAFNDNWFYFPAVVQTFMDAAGDGKRLAIVPHFEHGFPPHVDQTLIDFFDTTLTHTRPPYNDLGTLAVTVSDGKTWAEFSWTGDNPVKKAELVVSYGETAGWLGWRGRAAFVFPAVIDDGQRARARLPVPSRKVPLIAWGSVTDENDVLTSTAPVTLTRECLADYPVDEAVVLNAFIDGDLGEGVLSIYNLHQQPLGGVPDREVKHTGNQSLRFDPVADGESPDGLNIQRFFHVPGVAHTLSVWVRSDSPIPLNLTLTPVRPGGQRSRIVPLLAAADPFMKSLIPLWDAPCEPMSATAVAGPEWRQLSLDVPNPQAPVQFYRLQVKPAQTATDPWWIDTIHMMPLWPED